MALKSKEWFYKQCLAEIKNHTPNSHMAWVVVEKGVGQSDGTRGHVTQAVGVAQQFLETYPQHINSIKSADPTKPYDVTNNAALQNDLKTWIAGQSGTFGRSAYGYDYDSFKRNTTATLGGTRTGGGGADDEFKRVLRLMAEYI